MSLSIEVRQLDRAVVLELSGRLSVLESSLSQVVWKLIERGHRYFVINLGNVSYLDNSGLGQLCWIYTIARNRGGDMVLVNPTTRTRRLLEITKLNTVFRAFESEADALAGLCALTTAVSA